MGIREKLKEAPFILQMRKALHEKRFATHTNVNYFRGVYNSFTEAMADAPPTKPVGYNNPEAANMYDERATRVFSTDYPVLFWMERLRADVNSVFDFGGHIGVSYYGYSRKLNVESLNSWKVCDVPAVVERGQKFSMYSPDSPLSFTSEFKDCSGYDLLLANGSIQYLDWELHDKISELDKPPEYIIINMTPLHPDHSTITLQSIGTSFCPYYLRKELDFINGMENIGYRVIDIWDNEEKACKIAFHPERSLSYYRGMLLKYAKKAS